MLAQSNLIAIVCSALHYTSISILSHMDKYAYSFFIAKYTGNRF